MIRLHIDWRSIGRVLLLVALVVGVYRMGKRNNHNDLVDEPAPSFSMQTTQQNSEGVEAISLEALKGRAVVLEFWAPWCGACRSSFGMVADTELLFAESDVMFLGVNVENSLADQPLPHDLSLRSGIDLDGSIGTNYQVRVLPTFVIIDREGVIRNVIAGVPSADELQSSIKDVL